MSDNIFAVAMTLLVLNVRIPTPSEVGSSSDLWPHVAALWHHLRAFAVSFLIVGTFWEIHHRMFAHVRRVDRTVTWLNFAFMGIVVLIPFSAALLGNFDENAAAIAIYGTNLLAAQGVVLVMWLYVARREARGRDGIASSALTAHIVRGVVALGFALAVSLLAPPLSLWAFATATILPALVARRRPAVRVADDTLTTSSAREEPSDV